MRKIVALFSAIRSFQLFGISEKMSFCLCSRVCSPVFQKELQTTNNIELFRRSVRNHSPSTMFERK